MNTPYSLSFFEIPEYLRSGSISEKQIKNDENDDVIHVVLTDGSE